MKDEVPVVQHWSNGLAARVDEENVLEHLNFNDGSRNI